MILMLNKVVFIIILTQLISNVKKQILWDKMKWDLFT